MHDAGGGELLDTGVVVAPAGKTQLAPRIDLPPRAWQPAADGCDRLTGNGDVGLEHVAHGRDASAANEKVVGGLGHDNLSRYILSPEFQVFRSLQTCFHRIKAQIVPLHSLALSQQTVDHALLDGMVIASIVVLLRVGRAISTDASSRRKTPCPVRAFSSSIPIPTISLHKAWSKPLSRLA